MRLLAKTESCKSKVVSDSHRWIPQRLSQVCNVVRVSGTFQMITVLRLERRMERSGRRRRRRRRREASHRSSLRHRDREPSDRHGEYQFSRNCGTTYREGGENLLIAQIASSSARTFARIEPSRPDWPTRLTDAQVVISLSTYMDAVQTIRVSVILHGQGSCVPGLYVCGGGIQDPGVGAGTKRSIPSSVQPLALDVNRL